MSPAVRKQRECCSFAEVDDDVDFNSEIGFVGYGSMSSNCTKHCKLSKVNRKRARIEETAS